MKKVMMMALALVASATAFAGDSDALKAIKKAKTYAEAAQLVKTSQLANDEERAEAYNKLVDLAMEKVGKETGTIAQNQCSPYSWEPVRKRLMTPSDLLTLSATLSLPLSSVTNMTSFLMPRVR